jgi:hypothetical protein
VRWLPQSRHAHAGCAMARIPHDHGASAAQAFPIIHQARAPKLRAAVAGQRGGVHVPTCAIHALRARACPRATERGPLHGCSSPSAVLHDPRPTATCINAVRRRVVRCSPGAPGPRPAKRSAGCSSRPPSRRLVPAGVLHLATVRPLTARSSRRLLHTLSTIEHLPIGLAMTRSADRISGTSLGLLRRPAPRVLDAFSRQSMPDAEYLHRFSAYEHARNAARAARRDPVWRATMREFGSRVATDADLVPRRGESRTCGWRRTAQSGCSSIDVLGRRIFFRAAAGDGDPPRPRAPRGAPRAVDAGRSSARSEDTADRGEPLRDARRPVRSRGTPSASPSSRGCAGSGASRSA